MSVTVTLYRAVGSQELQMIRESGWRRFPPRLSGQPIFYPVVQEEYARKIARDWNVKAEGAGYVTRFGVRGEYLAQFDEQVVGGGQHTEYWIPAERLDEFNDNIVGGIEVVGEYHDDEWDVVYSLADDAETVKAVQRATLTTKEFGLVPEVALYGSADWWAAVADGRIVKYEVCGVISRVFMSGHGDWPEFEVDSEGVKTRWTRLGRQESYVEGKGVRVEYVLQRLRRGRPGEGIQKEVLRVLVKR